MSSPIAPLPLGAHLAGAARERDAGRRFRDGARALPSAVFPALVEAITQQASAVDRA